MLYTQSHKTNGVTKLKFLGMKLLFQIQTLDYRAPPLQAHPVFMVEFTETAQEGVGLCKPKTYDKSWKLNIKALKHSQKCAWNWIFSSKNKSHAIKINRELISNDLQLCDLTFPIS